VNKKTINIVGGGLAGSEAAYQIAKRGHNVRLYEMRNAKKQKFSDAHRTDKLGELVCSNSFRNNDINSGIGLLHEEMRMLDSLIMKSAEANRVPAGGALAVDREGFSEYIQKTLTELPNIKIIREEITELPVNSKEQWIIATGPLTSPPLFDSIKKHISDQHLSFFDAIAPIIYKDSIDFTKAWYQSRYDKGNGNDYINCSLTKEQYYEFVNDIKTAETTDFHDWEKAKYFDGCLPIEVMAERGDETLRFGPMKPVGLTNPHIKEKPYAIIQLRQDNKLGTLYNIVGFQTKMKHGEQKRIFRKIFGLENAKFARFGGIHQNSFINSPELLDKFMRLKTKENIMFAGQITGVEGYIESASMGLLAGIFSIQENSANNTPPPKTTAIGALLNHITLGYLTDNENKSKFQPMNVNFGIFPPLKEKIHKKERKEKYTERALNDLKNWIKQTN
jgi:methylenetetrahydrofolate--tRNA-(uracil-5-)-methyltransferase